MKTEDMAKTLAVVTTERTRIANLRCNDVVAIGRAPSVSYTHLADGDYAPSEKWLFTAGVSVHQHLVENSTRPLSYPTTALLPSCEMIFLSALSTKCLSLIHI